VRRALAALVLCAACIDKQGTLDEFCRANKAADCPGDGGTAGGSTAGGSTAGGSTAGGANAGGGTGGATAGGGASGGVTAGGAGGGSTAGGGAAGGMMTCPGSAAPLLPCRKTSLSTALSASWPSVSSNDAGFVVAWTENQSIRLRQLDLDGGTVGTPVSWAAFPAALDVVVSGADHGWALIWRDMQGIRCTTEPDGGVTTVDAGGPVATASVARGPGGAVGLIAGELMNNRVRYAMTAAGCPVELDRSFTPLRNPQGVTAVSTPGGFVFTVSGTSGAAGEINMVAQDGGRIQDTGTSDSVLEHAAAVSADGTQIQLATGVTGTDRLTLRSIRSDLTVPVPMSPALQLPYGRRWWGTSHCGFDCFAPTYVQVRDAGVGSVRTFLSRADSMARPGIADYTVVCDADPDTTGVAVGFYGGRLGVLVTQTSGADFYVCSVPP